MNTPLTDGKVLFMRPDGEDPGCVMASDCRTIEERLNECVTALEWCLSTRPSPCRCVEFATPPHICISHQAIANARKPLN